MKTATTRIDIPFKCFLDVRISCLKIIYKHVRADDLVWFMPVHKMFIKKNTDNGVIKKNKIIGIRVYCV